MPLVSRATWAPSRALDRGDLTRANIALVHAELDPLPDEAAAERLAKVDLALRKRAVRKAGFDPNEPRVPAGETGGGEWTDGGRSADSGSGGSGTREPDFSADPSGASVYDALYRPSAADPPIQPLGVAQTIDPTKPVPVVLPDGTTVTGPDGAPILMPSGVSLADNAALGELLSQEPSYITGPPPTIFDETERDAAMLALFQEYGPMDYQRSSGVFNADYRDFGNYNYGVVAAAAGYTKDQALAAAGAYNATRSNDTSGVYGNSPRNAEYIEKGYDDYVAGKITPNKN